MHLGHKSNSTDQLKHQMKVKSTKLLTIKILYLTSSFRISKCLIKHYIKSDDNASHDLINWISNSFIKSIKMCSYLFHSDISSRCWTLKLKWDGVCTESKTLQLFRYLSCKGWSSFRIHWALNPTQPYHQMYKFNLVLHLCTPNIRRLHIILLLWVCFDEFGIFSKNMALIPGKHSQL